jgi:hypothetical protein
MYKMVLLHLVERSRQLKNKNEIKLKEINDESLLEVINDIFKYNILSFHDLFKILSEKKEKNEDDPKSDNLSIKLLKNSIVNYFAKLQLETKENYELVKRDQEETLKLREDVQNLSSEAINFTSTNCSKCDDPLDLPSIHFMCKHSFHERCALEGHCSICEERDSKELEGMRKFLNTKPEKYDDFERSIKFTQIGKSEKISSRLGTGLFKSDLLFDINEAISAHVEDEEFSDISSDEEIIENEDDEEENKEDEDNFEEDENENNKENLIIEN